MTLRVVGEDPDRATDGAEPTPGRVSGAFDPWDTEKGHEYSEDHFYTRSTNKHDHSIDARFRFPPHLAAMVSGIVDSKRFPSLRSNADFYRDAAVHRLHHLNEMIQDGKYSKALSIEMRLARVEARRKEMEELTAALTTHEQTLELARQSEDYEAMSDTLADIEDDIPAFREPYKKNLKLLAAKYRRMLKDAPPSEPELDD